MFVCPMTKVDDTDLNANGEGLYRQPTDVRVQEEVKKIVKRY